MGSLISLQKLCKMKLLILSFLVAVSLAEPEADPQFFSTYGHHLGYSHLGYGYSGYPYTTAYYGKREAEAEPEAVYYAGHGHHLGYSHLGYGYSGYPYTTYYGKREAEADPQVMTYAVHHAVHHAVPAVHHAVVPYAAVLVHNVPGLVAHPNGAVVPVEPQEVVKARAEHLAAKASA